jgi:hypothetical protein
MENSFMNSKEAMRKACEEMGIKSVADALNISPSAIYNQINDEDKKDILGKFVDFVNACGNDVAINWACGELNGFFVRNPDTRVPEDIDPNCVPEALKEFGDVIKEIGGALSDGRVTRKEAEAIRREWDELKVLLETYVLSCEMGKLE